MAGTALAAIQLIPSWALLHASSRGEGLSLQERMQWALSPVRITEFVIPGFFAGIPGAGSDPVYSWLGGGTMYPLPFLPSAFLGLPVLLLALFGIRKSRASRMLGWSSLLFLWLSLGHYAGADYALGWVPIWSSFRYAEKLLGPFTLCVSTLAALGLERFTDRALPRAVRPLVISSVAIALFVALSAGLVRLSSPHYFIPEEVWVPLWKRFSMGLSLAAVGMVLIGIAGYRLSRAKEHAQGSAAQWVLSAVLLTGLAGSAAALHVGAPDSRARTPLMELRAGAGVPRIVIPVHDIAFPVPEGFDDFDALQAVMSRSGAAPFTVPSRVDNFTTYTGLVPGRFNALVGSLNAVGDDKWIAFRRYAVSHAVLTPPLSQPDELAAGAAISGGQRVSSDPEWNISVWEVPHQPWARFAEQVLPVSTEAEALAAVVRLESAKDKTTVLQGQRLATLSPGTVYSIERRPDVVRIEAEAPGDGLLVVADAFWDGWKATLDRQPMVIEIADGLVRAVRWPAGRHILEMRYDPVEVPLGAVVSGITALLLLGSVVWKRLTR